MKIEHLRTNNSYMKVGLLTIDWEENKYIMEADDSDTETTMILIRRTK